MSIIQLRGTLVRFRKLVGVSRVGMCMHAKSLQSCLTLCGRMDCSLRDSFVHGILQARILEWVAMPYLQGIFPTQGLNPCLLSLLHWQAGSLPLARPGKPKDIYRFYFLDISSVKWVYDLLFLQRKSPRLVN